MRANWISREISHSSNKVFPTFLLNFMIRKINYFIFYRRKKFRIGLYCLSATARLIISAAQEKNWIYNTAEIRIKSFHISFSLIFPHSIRARRLERKVLVSLSFTMRTTTRAVSEWKALHEIRVGQLSRFQFHSLLFIKCIRYCFMVICNAYLCALKYKCSYMFQYSNIISELLLKC